MKLDNHIVKRLLTDHTLAAEILYEMAERDKMEKGLDFEPERYANSFIMLEVTGNKNYFVTNTVLDKLELFDTKKAMTADGWAVFKDLPDFKKTFILDNNICIRVHKANGYIQFCHLSFTFDKGSREEGMAYWVLFYVDLNEGVICEHFNHQDVANTAPFIYALMCFTMLTDNEEIEVAPGRKHGTQKTGKLINTLPFPITIVNSKWNITTIRSEGFVVRGHIALRWTGPNRSKARLVYIAPYEKEGYKRTSGKQLNEK